GVACPAGEACEPSTGTCVSLDAGVPDAGGIDGGSGTDGGSAIDGGSPVDGGSGTDAGATDAGAATDAGGHDAGPTDAGAHLDASADGGPAPASGGCCGVAGSRGSGAAVLFAALALVALRRRRGQLS